MIDLKESASDAALVHDDLESNVLLAWEAGPWGDEEGIAATKQTIADAKARDDTIIVSIEAVNQRLIPVAIEPRSVLAEWNGIEDREFAELVYSRGAWFPRVPYPCYEGIEKTMDLYDSNAMRRYVPEDFYDATLIRELFESGVIDRLYR